MTPMLTFWLLSAAALCASIAALFVALRTSDRSLLKRFAALSASLSDLDDTVASLAQALNRERSRQNMRELRARRKPTENGGDVETGMALSEAEKDRWQRDMNFKIATGQVKVGPGR